MGDRTRDTRVQHPAHGLMRHKCPLCVRASSHPANTRRAPPTGWCLPLSPSLRRDLRGTRQSRVMLAGHKGPACASASSGLQETTGGRRPAPGSTVAQGGKEDSPATSLQCGLGIFSEGLGTQHVTCGALCPPASFQLFKSTRAQGSAEIWLMRANADGTGSGEAGGRTRVWSGPTVHTPWRGARTPSLPQHPVTPFAGGAQA